MRVKTPWSFRSQLALLFGLLSLLVGFPAYWYISSVHRAQLIEDRRERLGTLSESAASIVAENLNERRREIELLAATPLFRRAPLDSGEFSASLERLKQSYPYYSWIGIADAQGMVRVATSGHLRGVDVNARPWFIHGREAPFVGDLHEAVLLAKLMVTNTPGQPIRFIDFAAPILDDRGQLRGVLGAHAHWRWAGDVLAAVMPKQSENLGLDLFIVNQQYKIIFPEQSANEVRLPPIEELRSLGGNPFSRWEGDVEFLAATAPIKDPVSALPLGWRVVVRQPALAVTGNVHKLQRAVLAVSGGAFILFLLLAWIAAGQFSQPVERLTDLARRIAQGEGAASFNTQVRSHELQRLADALRNMAETLVSQKEALAQSNRALESKVAERTQELQTLNAELERLARTDALTGLPNRLSTNEKLREEFSRFKRSGVPHAVIMLDMDRFKQINDQHGHAAGDAVLRQAATIVRSAIREADFVGRVGGEELMIILPATPLASALEVAEKIRRAIAAATFERVGAVTASLGVAQVDESDRNDEDAAHRADHQLYAAKQGGRNAVRPLAA